MKALRGRTPPRELRGLWNVQYAPRENYIRARLGDAALKKWDKMTWPKKMQTIDAIQAKGYFGEG
jgi:hypothetical protein